MIKVLFVCHGNICRSTMSQSVFTYLVRQAGLEDCFEIDSAATSREEIGNPPHYGTRNKLRQVQIPLIAHHARQMTRQDYENFDFLIGMDSANIRNMTRIVGGDEEYLIIACRSFDSGLDKAYDNITVKKIPQMLLERCEFGKADYNLNIVHPPVYDDCDEEEEDV